MSYTQSDNLFVSVAERGINRAFAAVSLARPHLFHYSSIPGAGGGSGVTVVEPIKIPLSPVVLHWSLTIDVPQLDLYPDSAPPVPPVPPLSLNQFSLATAFRVEVYDAGSTTTGSSGTLPVRAVGQLTNAGSAQVPVLGFQVISIDVATVAPDPLRAIVDQIAKAFLQSVVDAVRIPIPALTLETVTVRLASPPPHPALPPLPIADSNAVEAWGVLQ